MHIIMALCFQNTKQLKEVESTTGTLGTKNFVPEDTGNQNTSPYLEKISEGGSFNNEEEDGVLPLTQENVTAFDSKSDHNHHSKPRDNGYTSDSSRKQTKTPASDPSRQSRFNYVKTPSTETNGYGNGTPRSKKMSTGSLPPLTPGRNGRLITKEQNSNVQRPKSLSPSNSPPLRMNRSYEYRLQKKTGFDNYRKLGIIPDWR